MTNFGEIYEVWKTKTAPSKTTARMTRTTLKYVASVHSADNWEDLPLLPQDHALVLLDAAMAPQNLTSQSRSNYRGYLRRLCRFIADEGIDARPDGDGRMWPSIPNSKGIGKRARVAYERFVKWAIRQNYWPSQVEGETLCKWALHEKAVANQHWRLDYRRLQSAWDHLVDQGQLTDITYAALPPPGNQSYGLPLVSWPAHLKEEWARMCADASHVLRQGGMRPWRDVTKQHNERRLCQFLGWYTSAAGNEIGSSDTWPDILSADNCREHLNWLVARNSKNHLNPGHTAFLRMVRGLHRFLLGSDDGIIKSFTELAKRCDVTERDKAVRIMPFRSLEAGLERLLETEARLAAQDISGNQRRLANLQVDALMLGLLVNRALRSRNLREAKLGNNLTQDGQAWHLKFAAAVMKGHRLFETSFPDKLVPILDRYLASGFKILTGRQIGHGDIVLVNRQGRSFEKTPFNQRVRQLTRQWLGKPLSPHLFRHIVATHGAQNLKMTPTELAAMLAHRSTTTVMRYYEVTNPTLAAQRFDELRNGTEGVG